MSECKTARNGSQVECLTHNQLYGGCVLDERDALRAEVKRLQEVKIPGLERNAVAWKEEAERTKLQVGEWKKRFGELKSAREERGDVSFLKLQVCALREFAQWMSGSPSFAKGGEAHEGFLKSRHLLAGPTSGESEEPLQNTNEVCQVTTREGWTKGLHCGKTKPCKDHDTNGPVIKPPSVELIALAKRAVIAANEEKKMLAGMTEAEREKYIDDWATKLAVEVAKLDD